MYQEFGKTFYKSFTGKKGGYRSGVEQLNNMSVSCLTISDFPLHWDFPLFCLNRRLDVHELMGVSTGNASKASSGKKAEKVV